MAILTISDFQSILGATFFNGDLTIAGLAMFAFLVAIVFYVTRNVFQSLIIGLPIMLIFGQLGVITNDMMVLLIIITVLGLAMTAKSTMSK